MVISMVIFGILKIAPGDPLSGFANNPNVPPELRAQIRKNMGLDDPIPVQYAKWAKSYITGDWQQSFLSKAPAREIIFDRLPTTLMIVGTAFLISVMIAIPVGVIAALKQYSLFDQAFDDLCLSWLQPADLLFRPRADLDLQFSAGLASLRLRQNHSRFLA